MFKVFTMVVVIDDHPENKLIFISQLDRFIVCQWTVYTFIRTVHLVLFIVKYLGPLTQVIRPQNRGE